MKRFGNRKYLYKSNLTRSLVQTLPNRTVRTHENFIRYIAKRNPPFAIDYLALGSKLIQELYAD